MNALCEGPGTAAQVAQQAKGVHVPLHIAGEHLAHGFTLELEVFLDGGFHDLWSFVVRRSNAKCCAKG